MQVQSLCREDPLEEGMATYSSILAWRIPWTEEPGRLQRVQRVAKSWTQLKQFSTNTRAFTLIQMISVLEGDPEINFKKLQTSSVALIICWLAISRGSKEGLGKCGFHK